MVNRRNMEKDANAGRRIYFDWAASAPNQVINTAFFFGNPSSLHNEGRLAKNALEEARNRAAAALNVPPQSLYFTSGGTESNAIALFSSLARPGKGRIIASLAEHASVREGMKTLERIGKPVGSITVDSTGRVTPETLTNALTRYGDVRFAAVMSVNNETGAVTDIASLKDVLRSSKAPIHLHCDMVQAVGKIPVDISNWEIDSASLSAHKLGGPRGTGLLYLRKPIDVFYTGGGQENGIRGGTENTLGAIAFAQCLERVCSEEFVEAKERWRRLITSLIAIDRCVIIPKERINNEDGFSPFILQAAFKGIPGEVMARALDDLGFAVSTGSACSSSSPERPVLAAMGIEENLRVEGIRISQGYATTNEEIDALIDGIKEVLKTL